MVLLTITPRLSAAIDRYHELIVPSRAEDENVPAKSEPGQPISHSQIIELSRALRQAPSAQDDSTSYHMAELLQGVRIYVQPPQPKPEPTPEYKALMARLRREQEQRQYNAMIAQADVKHSLFTGPGKRPQDHDRNEDDDDDDEMTYADINRQLTLVLNVLVSIVFCAAAVWLTAWHWPTPTRLFASMGAGLVVGVAEVVIYAGYIRRLREARVSEQRRREVRSVAETWQTAPAAVGGGSLSADGKPTSSDRVSTGGRAARAADSAKASGADVHQTQSTTTWRRQKS